MACIANTALAFISIRSNPQKLAVISHAHADHAIAGHAAVYCTDATSAFVETAIHGKKCGKRGI